MTNHSWFRRKRWFIGRRGQGGGGGGRGGGGEGRGEERREKRRKKKREKVAAGEERGRMGMGGRHQFSKVL